MSSDKVAPEKSPVSSIIKPYAQLGRCIFHDGLVNPLDDEVFERLAKLAEAESGKHPLFTIWPKRVVIEQECKLYPARDFTKGVDEAPMLRARITNSHEWDQDTIHRWEKKYGMQYTKTLEVIRNQTRIQ